MADINLEKTNIGKFFRAHKQQKSHLALLFSNNWDLTPINIARWEDFVGACPASEKPVVHKRLIANRASPHKVQD
ncbi:hypothetical protein [Limnohabitans sp. DM1]|uniref:hypothetical protein n=1 Tax=Limnohabitans sp. DM1 TaxID=1597955 RepID=UPI000A4B6A92|nr:hypothetical protein [Limnohabitans sp. DM1]